MDVGDNGGAGRGGVGPHPLVHALLVTVAMLLLPGTSHAQETCTPNDDIWCGVVTVGQVILSGNDVYADGFVAPSAGTAVGMLSEDSFTVGTNDYTIDSIFVEGSAGSGTPETLRFSLTNPPLPLAIKRVWSCMPAAARLLSKTALLLMTISTPGPVPVWTGPPRPPSRCG